MTLKHRELVVEIAKKITSSIEENVEKHDESKLHEPESSIFEEYSPKLKNSTYGSDEYKEFLKQMGVALEHHYEVNRHHPEHFVNYSCNGCFKDYRELPEIRCSDCGYGQFQKEPDITQMNLVDIIEMFCDWMAATARHDDGDIRESLKINQKRFRYSNDLLAILNNTVSFIEDFRTK